MIRKPTPEPHPRMRFLVDLHDGLLSGTRLARTERHLAGGCEHCDTRLARLKRTLVAIAAGEPSGPPPAAVRAVGGLLREAGLSGERGAEAFEAVLLLDSGSLAAAGMRSPVGSARRLLFAVAGLELDLAIISRPGGFDLLGQFLPGEAEVRAGSVEARKAGRRLAQDEFGTDGRFSLRGLRHGAVVLTGAVGDRAFRVRGVLVE